MMNISLGHFWIFELNHIVFDFGHLNTINILKCSNKCWKLIRVTGIIQKAPIIISRILLNDLIFKTNQKQIAEIEKNKTEQK